MIVDTGSVMLLLCLSILNIWISYKSVYNCNKKHLKLVPIHKERHKRED